MTGDPDLVEQLSRDYRRAPIGEKELAMLRYVEAVTLTPSRVTEADVQGLREAGFGDRAILGICQVAAYFAFVNRLADGLGVELEVGDGR